MADGTDKMTGDDRSGNANIPVVIPAGRPQDALARGDRARAEMFEYLTPEQDLLLERQPLQKLARDGELSVYQHDDFWLGMDTLRDIVALNDLWSTGSARRKI